MTEMTATRACLIIDGCDDEADEQDIIAAYQYLVDTGLAWQLQGRIGRTAMDLIEAGEVTLPLTSVEPTL